LPPQVEAQFRLRGGADLGSSQVIPVQGMPFAQAVEMRTIKEPRMSWDFQLGVKMPPKPQVIHKGDALWISVWMRATQTSNESHAGITQLAMDTASGRVLIYGMDAGAQWQQYAWAFPTVADYALDSISLTFRGGFRPQTIQLGGFQVLDYGPNVPLSSLPHSTIKYAGMEPEAPWRKEAADRIEKYRKGDIKVDVKDASGRPLTGATVHIQMVKNAFAFGSCVTPELLTGTGPDNDKYRDIVKSHYNKVVFENSLKWPAWEKGAGDQHKQLFEAIHWLASNNIDIRGHNLVWPGFRFMPPDVKNLQNDKVALEKRIEDHIRDEVGATRGMMTDWDVVNEPYAQHQVLDILGDNIIATWLNVAHEADPKPVLCINDYAGFMNKGEDTSQKDYFEKLLRTLKDEGAPITGLGIESHFGSDLIGPEQMYKELNRWAALGLKIELTEFDVNIPDEDVQAKFTHDFMTVAYSHPAVTTLLIWGFWEKAHWRPAAALYRKDWTIKPNGQAWDDLVLKQWHTDVTATTDATGSVTTRGFTGNYQVTVTSNGATKTFPLTLTTSGATLSAVMP
jgi:GH35 family endo-1,4-beta-xylanase